MRQERGSAKVVWIIVIAVIVLLGAGVLALIGIVGGWWYFSAQPVQPVAVEPVPALPAPNQPVPATTLPPPAPSAVPPVTDEVALARAAMEQYGSAADRAQYPFRVDNVQVRGNRATGVYNPIKANGQLDEERPGGLLVAQKVNGLWSVYALGTDIIDPWAEPISRIYGDQ